MKVEAIGVAPAFRVVLGMDFREAPRIPLPVSKQDTVIGRAGYSDSPYRTKCFPPGADRLSVHLRTYIRRSKNRDNCCPVSGEQQQGVLL